MYPYIGDFATGTTIFVPFHTFNSAGASVTLTGLAVTDIEIYKGASMTQRSSDAGYTLVDTDGIDLDGITGIHGFTIDTSNNTDSGFYAAGNDYTVVVSAVTIDSQTVNFIAARFSIENRRASMSSTVLNEIADALLKRDMGSVTGESARSPLNALRVLRNKVSVSGTTMTVTEEDDSTTAWTATLTLNAAADPITAIDPGGP